MLIKNRGEFIEYFEKLLIETGAREICKRCNEGEFLDSYNNKGCCTGCKYLSVNGCTNKNIRCVLASCNIIKDFIPSINWYLGYIQCYLDIYVYEDRSDPASINFPIEIPSFNQEIDWKDRFTEFSSSIRYRNRY